MEYDCNIETQVIEQAQLIIDMFHKMGIAGVSTVTDYKQAKARVTEEAIQLQDWQERKRKAPRVLVRTNCACKTCGKKCGCVKAGRICTDECACDADCANGDANGQTWMEKTNFHYGTATSTTGATSTMGSTGGSGLAPTMESPYRVPLQRTAPSAPFPPPPTLPNAPPPSDDTKKGR
jgi:hypothetical protein